MIIFGSLRIGARAWEKGEADTESQQRERVVLELMKQQISSISAREIKHEDDKSFLFKGNDKSMEFMTTRPAVYGIRSGLVYVKYVITEGNKGAEQVALYEQDALSVETQGIPDVPDESKFHALIPHARQIRFDYLKKKEDKVDAAEWQETWDPDSDEELPSAVRITFQRQKDKRPIRVIAPIYPEVTESVSNEIARKR